MKFILNDKEISLSELKNILKEVDNCQDEAGTVELTKVDTENNSLYFEIYYYGIYE